MLMQTIPYPDSGDDRRLASDSAALILAETLLHLSAEVLETANSDSLITQVLRLLKRLVNYDRAAIHLLEGDRLVHRAAVDAGQRLLDPTGDDDEGEFLERLLAGESRHFLTADLQEEQQGPGTGFEAVRSFMAVPLSIDDRMTGVLSVAHFQPGEYDDGQLELAALFARHAALALNKVYLLSAERQQRRFVESQLDFSYRLMQRQSTQEAIEALLDAIDDIAHFDAGAVVLLGIAHSGTSSTAAVYPQGAKEDTRYAGIEEKYPDLFARLMEERRPINVTDLESHSHRRSPAQEKPQEEAQENVQETGSLLLVPLLAENHSEPLGYLSLHCVQSHQFPDTTQQNVVLLCNQAAVALRTLGLLEESRRRLADVSVLVELSAYLNRSHDLNETLNFVLNRVVSVLSPERDAGDIRGVIILRVPGSDALYVAASHGVEPEEIERFNRGSYTAQMGTFQRSIDRGEWVEIADAEEVSAAISPAFSRVAPTQILDIPLRVGAETIGAISLDRVTQGEATRQLLTAIADLAGAAIQKTRALEVSRQRAVELMETFERLHAADQQRNEFIQNVTHDLKAPLTFIRGYAELMEDEALGEITEEQREALAVIQDRVDAVNKMIEEILVAEEIESTPLEMSPLNLDAVARVSARNARMAARLAGLDIRMTTPTKRAMVLGDETRLEQVFENLLSNAIKYSPDGGVIQIAVETSDGKITASVTDQGIGIPPEELENIWNRSYRIGQGATGGSGLGLANVKRIIEAHGGRIWAQSQGLGTTFTFELPAHRG